MTAPKVELTVFTDPYCSWCWAVEPVLLRLNETYREQITFRYVMGGMVRDAGIYGKAGFRNMADVAPHWRLVSEKTGQPIDERLMTDITNPNFSTWPACIAVKSAELQSSQLGEAYLRRIRRAALSERKLVSNVEVYEALAQEVEDLDVERFKEDIANGSAERAFDEDLQECASFGITGFPSILVHDERQGVMATGFRPFEAYKSAIERLVGLLEEHTPRELDEVLADYGPLTTRELAEVYGKSDEDMLAQMEALASDGRVEKMEVRRGEVWSVLAPSMEENRNHEARQV